MRVVSYVLIVYSLIWATAPFSAINLPARVLLDISDWPFGDAPAVMDGSTMWLSAIGSGLLLAISLLFLGIVAPALERGDQQIVRVAIWAMVAWYVVDSGGSFAAGVPSNVFFNTVYLVLMLVPMLMVNYGTTKKRVAQATR